jgi:hypothetical protein
MKKISDLNKDELLSLIYHHLPKTHFEDHPVLCASCGDRPHDELVNHNGQVVTLLVYVCDRCDEVSNDNRR